MDMTQLIAIALVLVTVVIIGFALLPYFTGELRGEKRQDAILRNTGVGANVAKTNQKDANNRRKQIAESLKELEAAESGKKKKLTLETRIAQAGYEFSRAKFYMACIITGSLVGFIVFMTTGNLIYASAAVGIGGFGIPNWVLNYLRNRRINKFVQEFPNAVDVIIRGVKAGLPLGDCLRIIAVEAAEPVRTEFRKIVESQSIGLTMAEAVERLYENIPTAEANFFGIVINIQQKAGGNLSEALGNLSRVLRERKKMKLKIKSMSSEAKASAYIIGALPFIVSGMVYLTSPKYMEILWLHPSGRVVMAVCGFWMLIGILSMKKMINFDF